jgi:protein-tyrosine-phosphatase
MSGMPHRLMFVCAMNVCRSPLMAFTFADALAAANEDEANWSVTSRGTAVLRSDPMCDISASLITGSESGQEFAQTHESKPLSSAELQAQDLILVASRAERAKIAQMNPRLRSRTFTVREALALGAPAVTQADLDLMARARVPHQKIRLAGYTQLLHQRRGTVPVPTVRRLPWSLRRPIDPADIPDVHHKKRPQHTAMLKSAQSDVRDLHELIQAFLTDRAEL